MFDFLNKLTHNHSPPPVVEAEFEDLSSENQNSVERIDNSQHYEEQMSRKNSSQVIKKPKPNIQPIKKVKKVQSRVLKLQYGGTAQLNPHVLSILQGQLQQSKKAITIHRKKETSQLIGQMITEARIEKQRNVYIRYMSKSQSEYLGQAQNFVSFQNNYVKETLGFTINSIIQQISYQIEQDQYDIRMQGHKNQSVDNHKLETLVKIKKAQNELQSKIGQLSIDLNNIGQSIIDKRAKQIVEKDSFNPDSHKTKMAQVFVREKQRERQEIKNKMEQFKQRKRSIEIRSQEQQQQRAKRQKEQRHEKLKQQFLEKKRLRQQRQAKARTQQKQYKQFLKEFKGIKPLFQIKQEQFKKKQKEEKKQRYHLLRQKQKLYAPIDLQTIEMHEQRYDELREEDRLRKQAQIDLQKKEEILRKQELDKKAYKGKFRYLILKQMVEQQNKKKQKQEQKQRILMRKHAYSLQVKDRFKPEIDFTKRRQVQQMINSHKNTNRKYHTPNRVAYSQRYSTINQKMESYSQPQTDAKLEGRKYHRQFKQYIRDKIEKGQIKQEQQSSQYQTIKPKAPNYLKELRQRYENLIPSQSSRLQRQIANLQEGDDCSILIMKAQQYERKAKRREMKIRNVPHRPQQQARLEEQYLCAIKAKISLIDKMD